MTIEDHAPLPPSSAHIWVRCNGWYKMNQSIDPLPEDETKAQEGTAAHWAMEEVLRGHKIAPGQIAPNGVMLTDEMCEGADIMDDAIGAERGSLFVESRVDIPWVHADNWGTPDAWRLHSNIVDVWDYKFGHRHVPAFENWQMLDYACGIVGTLQLTPLQVSGIRMTIVQPRDYHSSGPVRSWTISFEEMKVYLNRLRGSAEANIYGNQPCVSGAYCRDCKARHACPTLQAVSLDECDRAYDPIPLVLSKQALSRQLVVMDDAIALLQARRDGLAAQATATIKRGESIPNWTLRQGEGRERWSRPPEEIVTLGNLMGVDVSKPTVITPKQAIKKGLPLEVVAGFTETPKGEFKLVRDDGTAARQAFQQS